MPRAVQIMVQEVGLPLDQALRMVTTTPAKLLGRLSDLGQFKPGMPADMVHLDGNLQLAAVWRAGERLAA